MLSKVLRGPESRKVPAMVWPGSGGAAPSAAAGAAGERADARSPELQQQIERRVADAHQAGLQEGEAAAHSRAESQIQPVIERLSRGIQELAALRPGLLRQCEAELVELSLGIARRILHRELAVDPDALQGLVKSALEKLQGQQVCRVLAHPELVSRLRHALEQQGQPGVEVLADASLEAGGLVVETERGKLDASLETQLEEIGRGLADRLSRA
jgi:flagellar assembly protein FliH